MTTYDSFDTLADMARQAVISLLYRMADDELIIGHCDVEWADRAEAWEHGDAFLTLARDEIAHAQAYYAMLNELGEPEPAALAYGRGPRELRCASVVSLPVGGWEFALLRRFLYDAAENIRLASMAAGTLEPLARFAAKLHTTEKDHLRRSRAWVLQLSDSGEENRLRMQEALNGVYPHALGLFEPTETDHVLGRTGISRSERHLRREWESAVAPVLARAKLQVDAALQPIHGGRDGQRPKALAELLARIKLKRQLE